MIQSNMLADIGLNLRTFFNGCTETDADKNARKSRERAEHREDALKTITHSLCKDVYSDSFSVQMAATYTLDFLRNCWSLRPIELIQETDRLEAALEKAGVLINNPEGRVFKQALMSVWSARPSFDNEFTDRLGVLAITGRAPDYPPIHSLHQSP